MTDSVSICPSVPSHLWLSPMLSSCLSVCVCLCPPVRVRQGQAAQKTSVSQSSFLCHDFHSIIAASLPVRLSVCVRLFTAVSSFFLPSFSLVVPSWCFSQTGSCKHAGHFGAQIHPRLVRGREQQKKGKSWKEDGREGVAPSSCTPFYTNLHPLKRWHLPSLGRTSHLSGFGHRSSLDSPAPWLFSAHARAGAGNLRRSFPNGSSSLSVVGHF